MMTRYRIDVKPWGTAYIEAETREVGSEVAHMEDMLELRGEAWRDQSVVLSSRARITHPSNGALQ